MKTPAFWKSRNAVAVSLLPLAFLYQLGYRLRRIVIRPTKPPIPVLCIGDLVTGGAGKTPVALAIGEWFKRRGVRACFLSRGYGGTIRRPTLLRPHHTAEDAGDEPLLLAKTLPVIIGASRLETAEFAAFQGFELAIMDDGFQNPAIRPTASFVVIDNGYGFGNGLTLPAGPLREPPAFGLKRADAVIVTEREEQPVQNLALPSGLPVLRVHLRTVCPANLSGRAIIAFSGIARPEQFFGALESQGALLVSRHAFADHHAFTQGELEELAAEAAAANAVLVTTAKDAARLPQTERAVIVADIALNWQDAAALDALLIPYLPKEKPNA